MDFSEFDFGPEIWDGIEAMGFQKATPIQEHSIPTILEGHDLVACAQTGTGKTAAYLLPVLDRILDLPAGGINTVILVPTRELALQIDQQIQGFSYFADVSAIPIYGGGDGSTWEQQKKAITEGSDVLIATPGRLISYINLQLIDFSSVKHLILDEADRMLDMGFYNDLVKIVDQLPKERQTLLFSATMPPKIRKLASNILKDPKEVNIAISKPAEGILQCAYMVYDKQKHALITSLLQDKSDLRSIIVFTSRKADVDGLVKEMKRHKFSCEGIHSDLDQKARENVLLSFKNRHTQILVATDILSRGIDIDTIDLVVNYEVPADAEDYVHRVGRTARAERTGVAITFVNQDDQVKFKRIEDLIERDILKLPVPPELGESPVYNPQPPKKKRKWKSSSKKKNFKKKKPAGKQEKKK
ncbi:DEAD/DEAH box helicase [Puteibacter caeruleilacunae]|nr:DEAD/DEAH box helicase [Puteibacter caeruleilacunae]